ncbi:MAG: F0F1 ATP synthase subunit B [Hyphomicrobiales bacterium]
MSLFATPEFWVAASFVGFIGVIVYFKVPGMVGKALDTRAEAIRLELDEARRLREEAQAILSEYQRKQRDADKEAESIIRMAQSEAKALAKESRAALTESIERRTRIAEAKIARAEEQAMGEVRAVAVETAIAAAEKLIEKKLTPAEANKLVDSAIESLKGKLN